jgi:peptidoglycan/LPS O-acetylase OafA/YrhL
MEKIGGSSYAIYLYHPLFIAAVLFAAGAQAGAPTSLLFVGAGVAGIAGPMLMEHVSRRIPAGQLLLEGRVASSVVRRDEVQSIPGRVPADVNQRRAAGSVPAKDDPLRLDGVGKPDADVQMAVAGATS